MATFVKISGEPKSFEINAPLATFVRISALSWANLLATFAVYLVMNYLTDVWNLSSIHAAGIINIWDGISAVLAIVFAFFVDAFTGDFYMLAVSSIAYCVGLGLLTMSTPPVFGPCKDYKKECIGHTQKVLFFTALPLISVGMAGRIVSVVRFLEKQNKEKKKNLNQNQNPNLNPNPNPNENENGKKNKICRKIPVFTMLIIVSIAGCLVVSYVKSWVLRFGIPAICSVVATLLFFTGWLDYKRVDPQGSPLTTNLRVFVATVRNFSQPIPDPKDLDNEDNTPSTSTLRWFDKAAIKLPERHRWKVCNVREVEETKICIRMLPMWLTFIVIGIVLSIGNTYFLEQVNNMDRKLGKINVPIPIILVFYTVVSAIFARLYTFLSKKTKKYAPPIGIATSMFLSILCCITASKVETLKLHRIRDHGLIDKPKDKIPMSMFALLPQFMLLAAVDGVAKKSITGFFRNQTPKSLRNYLFHFTRGVLGLGSMASALLVYVVGMLSERNGKPNWFRYTLNNSRLDRYYQVLAELSAVNLVIYIIIAYFYKYREPPDDDDDDDGNVEVEVVVT